MDRCISLSISMDKNIEKSGRSKQQNFKKNISTKMLSGWAIIILKICFDGKIVFKYLTIC